VDVNGATAFVTGGASGIGFGIATALARRGANVVIADIESERALEAADRLTAQGLNASALHLDVIDEAQWADAADVAEHRWGSPVQLLFNNAGIGAGGTVHGAPQRTWDWVMAVNLGGVVNGVRTFVPRMLAGGLPSAIVNTGSEHSLGLPPSGRGGISAAYTSIKHAVMGYSLCMRRDFAGSNIQAGIVCPGLVATDIWNSFRNRHDAFGGPRQGSPQGATAMSHGLSPQTAGERIVEQVEDDQFFIFTNGPDEAEVLETFAAEATAAMTAFRRRYGV
jgi:NAD(P)-dependent dehydrogenase (short-subunit alcohol dehydrogenase family)